MDKKTLAIPAANGIPAANMQTIAEQLGLSVATVSRSLSGVPGIKPATRARVVQAAVQAGYRSPKIYRTAQLSGARLHHVGVLIEMPVNHVLPNGYIIGLSDAAMTLNASLVIHYVKAEECEQILNPEHQPRAMRAGLLSGLILVFQWPVEIVRELSRARPIVSITHKYPGVSTDVVGIDNLDGIDLIVGHLHELGHRKIGFFGRCGALYWSRVRFGAYMSALTNFGLPCCQEWVVDVDARHLTNLNADWDDDCARAGSLLGEGVTAWVCVSEPAGWQLTGWLRAHDIRVPGQVSVSGFHAPDQPEAGRPMLTSVKASYEAIGAAALKRVLHRIQNPAETTRSILFPGELQIGDTTAPPVLI